MREHKLDQIFALFAKRGDTEYFGERVSQTQHALQVAYFAAQERAPESLIAARCCTISDTCFQMRKTRRRGVLTDVTRNDGEIWLRRYFSPAVTEPIRLHVEAKRYLCHLDPSYPGTLSATSLVSLKLQGGAFNKSEAAEFERRLYASEAVRLRRWDDSGKIPGLDVPRLETYRALLLQQAALHQCE